MINYCLCSKCEHEILERVVLQLKRLHKIATVRRLVALTMLSTLLLSSTAVYADTAEDVEKTSQEVVIETGNTSNDTNSSTNQNYTVSGRDSIENSSTTTTEYDKEDTNKGDSDSSDLNPWVVIAINCVIVVAGAASIIYIVNAQNKNLYNKLDSIQNELKELQTKKEKTSAEKIVNEETKTKTKKTTKK